MKSKLSVWAVFIWVFLSQAGLAQEYDPFQKTLFSPEDIMNHQDKIGLSDEQEIIIRDLLEGHQSDFLNLNWDLKSLMAGLGDILSDTSIDEVKAQAQLDKILALETQIKKKHISLMIQIKNLLSREQQEKLKALL